jgi:hypothetical protein
MEDVALFCHLLGAFSLVSGAVVAGAAFESARRRSSLGDGGSDAGWVDAAFLLFIAAAVLGGLGGRAPRKARSLASRLAEEGKPASPELRALLDDRGTQLMNYGSAFLIVAVLVLMVWKPGAAQA